MQAGVILMSVNNGEESNPAAVTWESGPINPIPLIRSPISSVGQAIQADAAAISCDASMDPKSPYRAFGIRTNKLQMPVTGNNLKKLRSVVDWAASCVKVVITYRMHIISLPNPAHKHV